jgi:hypothetical protein
MRCRVFLFLLFLAAPVARAQEWRFFGDGALFATYVSETGPPSPENRAFSTNWAEIGVARDFSPSSSIAFGARLSAEPLTIPTEGYPQLLQYVSPESGGPLVDHMRAHDAVEELAMQLSWRMLRVYLAPVGEPPLGATPFAQRSSSIDFAEAPFAYDVAESFHVGTRVAAIGVATKAVTVEGGVFHASHTTDRHSSLDDGKVDSWSARATLHVTPRFSVQASHGKLGDAKQQVTSLSGSYDGSMLALTALWTKRDPLNAYGVEAAVRGGRSTFMARVETVDRPAGVFEPLLRSTTHFTIGYILDVMRGARFRTGIGANVDYHVSSKTLGDRYGHKPQGVYAFVRVRTTPPASP